MMVVLLMPHPIQTEANEGCSQPNTRNEMDKLLTNEALKQGVPPEIVKAIAFAEAKGWQHCEGNGEVLVSPDGGVGVMQVTDHENEYGLEREKLKDVHYNIEKGVYILKRKFNQTNLPLINDGNPDIIENWYFAVMAYNGIGSGNSPIYRRGGETHGQINKESYQYKVFNILQRSNPGMQLNLVDKQVKVDDLEYVPVGNGDRDIINFIKKEYTYDGPLNYTSHRFQVNDLVRLDEKVSRRIEPRTDKDRYPTDFQPGILSVESTFKTDMTPKENLSSFNHFGWYYASNGEKNGVSGHVASSYLKPFGKRISGSDRYLTAAAIAQEGWDKADTVIIANGTNFPDALSGAPLAYKLNAPILLTSGKQAHLNSDTKNMIKQLGAKNAIILGSEGAVSGEVEDALNKELKLSVKRIGGVDRYETAAKIAKELGGNPSKAIIANGSNFPDALAIASYAAQNGFPILLTKGQDNQKKRFGLNEYTARTLKELRISSTIAVGGESAVSPQAYGELPQDRKRISGINRYETATKIIEELNLSTDSLYVASGNGFADALTGSVLAAKNEAAVLLVGKNTGLETTNLLKKKKVNEFQVLGGSAAVSNQLLAKLIIK